MNYKMTQQQLEQFALIYNTLSTVNTKGEDTINMANCLQAMRQLFEEVQKQTISEDNPEEE